MQNWGTNNGRRIVLYPNDTTAFHQSFNRSQPNGSIPYIAGKQLEFEFLPDGRLLFISLDGQQDDHIPTEEFNKIAGYYMAAIDWRHPAVRLIAPELYEERMRLARERERNRY